jgi:hypothetical protein
VQRRIDDADANDPDEEETQVNPQSKGQESVVTSQALMRWNSGQRRISLRKNLFVYEEA